MTGADAPPAHLARPAFHFTAPRGWINDPHGITVKDGNYHRFYQYVPDSPVWAPNCHWGHVRGPDLFTFDQLPVALAPGDGDDGIWTGCLVQDGDATYIFYTSVSVPDFGIGRVRVAVPKDDEWVEWDKREFVVDAPDELDLVAFRDPFVVREEEGWRMFVGAGITDGTASALTYTSTDLHTWEYRGGALERASAETEPVWTGALWECPQVVGLDGRHVMISSVWDDDVLHYAAYAVGTYEDGRFAAHAWGRLTFGPSYYAPSFHRDAQGRPCVTFWMREVEAPDRTWVGAHSIPHVLSLRDDVLVATPHPDIEQYRCPDSTTGRLDSPAVDLVWTPGSVLVIDGDDSPRITVSAQGKSVELEIAGDTWSVPYVAGAVRIVIDGPILELSTTAGLLGLPVIPAAGYSVRADGDELSAAPLRR